SAANHQTCAASIQYLDRIRHMLSPSYTQLRNMHTAPLLRHVVGAKSAWDAAEAETALATVGEVGGPQVYFFAVFLGFRFSLFFGLLSPTAHLLSGLMVCPDEQTSDRYATSIPEAFRRRLRRFLNVYTHEARPNPLTGRLLRISRTSCVRP